MPISAGLLDSQVAPGKTTPGIVPCPWAGERGQVVNWTSASKRVSAHGRPLLFLTGLKSFIDISS